MMKHLYLLVFVILMSNLCGYAQDYQTVRSGRIAFFDIDHSKIKCIRIDSVSFDKDSILVPMLNFQQLGNNCFIPKGNSWIGKKVIIQKDGFNLFFNNNNDTIRINTLAKVGETWTLFEIKDSIKILAEVKSAEIQTILGEQDSVKTIGLKVYDKNGLATNHPVSERTILISKNSGFVKAMGFNEFPEDRDFTYFESLESLSLVGLTNPDRGVQNLTWLSVHDYQAGDELHVISNSWNWSGVPGYRYEQNTILKFLERKESKDSVFYRIERKESLKKSIERWDNITYSFTHDTIVQAYGPDSLFDKLTGEPIIMDHVAHTYAMINDGTFLMKFQIDPIIMGPLNDSCWHFFLFHSGGSGHYLKGLGGPYYEWNEIISGDDRGLVYYKKGTTKWGTPLVITGVENIEKEDEINIYPNPAIDFIMIKNISGRKEKYGISLTDMQGREIFRNEAEISNTYQLDVTSIKEGAYLLKLQNGKKQITRMIIKK